MNIIKNGQFGIEKESLRVNQKYEVVNTLHPVQKKFKNHHITVDFSEQQVEFITGKHKSIQKAVEEIKILTHVFYRQMNKNEFLWNYSMPPMSYKNATIAIGNKEEVQYRTQLIKKYPLKKQLISGIHFNFSFDEKIIKEMTTSNINKLYFKIFKKFLKYNQLFIQIFGMSSTTNFKDYECISCRQNPSTGYKNHFDINSSIGNNYEEYKKMINKKIKDQEILSWRENYSPIRLKPFNEKEIKWIEIRGIDLDYSSKYGTNINSLKLIHQIIIFLAFGKQKTIMHSKINGSISNDFSLAVSFLKELKSFNIKNNISNKIVDIKLSEIKNNKLPYRKVINKEKMIKYQQEIINEERETIIYPLKNMELSTRILLLEAYLNGHFVELISKTKNKIKIDGVLLEMATLNPFDSKKGLKIISDKIATNKFLKENSFKTTNQYIYYSVQEAVKDFNNFKNKKIVVKPVNTNFSTGLTIFNRGMTKNEFRKALEFAFQYDNVILVEDFVIGKEYRFLVIDNNLVGVLFRKPANVIGDGKSTVEKLVKLKNKNPLRGTSYKKPLEKINLGKIELDFIKKQGYSRKSILNKKQILYLRKNSNISTGGDTIDVTDKVHEEYKNIAIKAAQKLDLYICGLDIIIPNIQKVKNYTILEINWNPAIHIHTYPLIGKNRNPSKFILNLINSKNQKNN